MFRLKGDICRQLSKKYKVSFRERYKVEIKERIHYFLNNLERNIKEELSLTERLEYLKDKIYIVNNEIIGFNNELLNEELFNLFNTTWYEKKEKFCYTKKEEKEILTAFVSNICYETYKTVLEKEINYELLKNFNSDNMESTSPLYQIEKTKESYNKLNIEGIDISYCVKKIKNNQILKKIKEKVDKFKSEIVLFKNNEFKNYKILMDKDVCFYGVLETKELDIFKNFDGKIEKARLLNRKTVRKRTTEVNMERVEIGYQDVSDYILFYIETKCLIEIEKIIKENS